MLKITDEMKEVAKKSKCFAVATVSEDGDPNVVPNGLGKVFSEDEILLVKLFEGKTLNNLRRNPKVAVSVWDMERVKGYQFKGNARIETSGKAFDEGDKMAKSIMLKARTKAVIIVKVDTIYVTSPGPNAGKEIK